MCEAQCGLSTHPANTGRWPIAGPPSATLTQHQNSTGSKPRVCWAAFNSSWSGSTYCWRWVQADIDPMSVKCWASVAGAGQYLFSPSQYFMLAVPARWCEPKLDSYWPAMFAQHRRRWVNISPALGQRLVFAGAACDFTMKNIGQIDRQKRQTHWADKGKPTCLHLYVQRGRHNKCKLGAGIVFQCGLCDT